MESKYTSLIEEMVQLLGKSIVGDEDKDILEQQYRKYLVESVHQLVDEKSFYPISDEKLLEKILKDSTQDLVNSPIEYKKQLLLEDKYLNEIKDISCRIYQAAVDAIEKQNKHTIQNPDLLQKRMESLLEKVKPWNCQQAKELISEANIELGIIKNPSTSIYSLRLGEIYFNKGEER